MTKAWMMASGKGGVGKSSLAAGLAVLLAKRQKHVLLLDADVGLRSLDLMLGLQDRILYELKDCLDHTCALEQTIVTHPNYPLLHLIVAGQSAKPRDFDHPEMADIMAHLRLRYDVILVDGPAGIGRNLRSFAGVSDEVIVVATPDEVSLRDAEKTASLIRAQTNKTPYLILNRINPSLVTLGRMRAPTEMAMDLDLPLLGEIPDSGRVYTGLLNGQSMAECGDERLLTALRAAASRLSGEEVPYDVYRSGRLAKWVKQIEEAINRW